MKRGKMIILFLTAFLLLLAFAAGMKEETVEEVNISLSFSAKMGSYSETIRCVENPDGAYFVFLPSYMSMENVSVSSVNAEMQIGQVPLTAGMSCEAFQLDTEYPFSIESADHCVQSTIAFVRSGTVPSLYIDTRSGSMEYIHAEKGNEESGDLRLYDAKGHLLHGGKTISLEGRGNSSWDADKKPYNLTVQQEADLLGMGEAQRWVLLGEGFLSCINIRNKIVYDYAETVNLPFCPEGQWVDLYLNGEYAGLYLLSERNEVHPERVAIQPDTGFLVSMEWETRLQEQKYPYVLTDRGQALRIHQSSKTVAELDEQWQSLENAIMAEDGIDSVSGKSWKDLMDLDSWARKYLLEEMFGNHDGGSFSQFYYYDSSVDPDRIYAGPIWDYDLAMGGYDSWLKDYVNYLIMNREYKEDGLYTPWGHALYQKEEFRQRLEELYRTEFLPAMNDLLECRFEEIVSSMSPAFQQDARRWGYSWGSVQREMEYIRTYLKQRTELLSDMWINGTQYYVVQVDPGRQDIYGHMAVKAGECLPELFYYQDSRNLGWHVLETDEPFDVTQPIFADVHIYMKNAEFQLPKIHFVPLLAVAGAIPALLLLDATISKKNGRKKR